MHRRPFAVATAEERDALLMAMDLTGDAGCRQSRSPLRGGSWHILGVLSGGPLAIAVWLT
jgi:hypothetical protein